MVVTSLLTSGSGGKLLLSGLNVHRVERGKSLSMGNGVIFDGLSLWRCATWWTVH